MSPNDTQTKAKIKWILISPSTSAYNLTKYVLVTLMQYSPLLYPFNITNSI